LARLLLFVLFAVYNQMHVFEYALTFARSNFQRLRIGCQYPTIAFRLSMRDHVFIGFEFLVEATLRSFRGLVRHAAFIGFEERCSNDALILLSFEQSWDKGLEEHSGHALLRRHHSSRINGSEIILGFWFAFPF